MVSGCASTRNYDHLPLYTDQNRDVSGDVHSPEALFENLQEHEYRIEVGDILLISVWRENDLKEEVIVRPDGRISFPLAGDVPAAGTTFIELKEAITTRLTEYLKEPVVSISLKQPGSRKIIVLGEVGHPGVFSVTGRKTVLEAIALAMGFTEHAVQSSVIHVRKGPDGPEAMRLNLAFAMDETDRNNNIPLQSEDIVYVPKKFIADVNYYARQIIQPIATSVWTVRGIQELD